MKCDAKVLRPRWWKEAVRLRVMTLRAHRAFTGPYVYDKVVEGEQFSFFISDATAEAWYGRRSDKNDIEMRFVRDHMLRAGDVVIEVGAHHGKDTVLLSKWVGPSGKVFAFEPLAKNVAAIEKNIDLNALENVDVVRAALGATDGTVSMSVESNSHVVLDPGGSVASANGDAALADSNVSLMAIDTFCAKKGVIPDLIKIDVEGFEFEVLKGAAQTLAAHRPAVQIEVHGDQLHRYGTKASALWDLVDAQSYEVYLQQNDLVGPERCAYPVKLAGRVHVFFKRKP